MCQHVSFLYTGDCVYSEVRLNALAENFFVDHTQQQSNDNEPFLLKDVYILLQQVMEG